MDDEMYYVLKRYLEDYGWNYGVATKLINREFHTDYKADELRKLYNQKKRCVENESAKSEKT